LDIGWIIGVSFLAGAGILLYTSLQTGSGAHPASGALSLG